MKKLIVLILISILALGLAAQSAKQEALQSIDDAKAMINSNQLAKAQEELNYAITKISEILSEELLKFIPDAPAGYTLEDRSAQSLGQAGVIIGSANAIAASGNYSKGDSSLELSITVGGLVGQAGGLMGLAAMFGGMTGSNTKSLRVSGYNATSEYDATGKSGTLTIKVGEKITVMVEGEDIDSADMLKTLAEKVDLAGLEKAF
jgi:hypothetical protein